MNAVLKYPGAKWRISEWIISHFPEHKVYCEPFFGSGAVFFNKPQTYIVEKLWFNFERMYEVLI